MAKKYEFKKVRITVEYLVSKNNGKNFEPDSDQRDNHKVYEFREIYTCHQNGKFLHLYANQIGHLETVWTAKQIKEKLGIK